MNRYPRTFPRPTRIASAMRVLALAAVLSGCTTTQAVKPEMTEGRCAYLAPDLCSKLTAGASGQNVALRYLAPDIQWSQYTKVMVSPVLAYGGMSRQMSAEDAQALCNYLYQALLEQFGTKFTIVDTPGPGVVKIQTALTDAQSAVPVLRTVSMLIPQVRALATLKYLATDSYPFVGGAQGELEATDSRTGQVLGAALDRQIGGGSLVTAAQWQWGDAKNSMDRWAALAVTRLAAQIEGKPPS